jgi:RNA polymerase sigma-70 factor (ECF subfamily)
MNHGANDSPDNRAHVEAVSRLFQEHNRSLVGFLRARLRNEQEARDVAQEAYVRLLQLYQPGAVSFLRAYLFRIAQNLAVDLIRQRSNRTRLDSAVLSAEMSEECSAERKAIAEQELRLLQTAVSEMPPKCQRAFQLHKIEDRPLAEVAEMMGVTDRMVRKYLARVLVYVRLRRERVSVSQTNVQLGLQPPRLSYSSESPGFPGRFSFFE